MALFRINWQNTDLINPFLFQACLFAGFFSLFQMRSNFFTFGGRA